jgi:hypothetical protein
MLRTCQPKARSVPPPDSRRSLVPLLVLVLATVAWPRAGGAASMVSADEFPRIAPRIVNGTLTAQYPTAGALLSPGNPATAGAHCSGTLIGCETFLTAAHCVCDTIGSDCQGLGAPDPSNYVVFLQHAGFFNVASIAVHPDFDFPVGDVAVIKLASPVTGIAPTVINGGRAPADGSVGTLVGFGSSGGAASDYGLKRTGAVHVAPCTNGISDTTSVCWNFTAPVGPPGSDVNTCYGDSGGPLFIDFGCGDAVAGITSGGSSASCLPTDNSYDANVYDYHSYIETEGGADLANTFCGDMPQAGDGNTTILTASGSLSFANTQGTHAFTVAAGTTLLRVAMNAIDDGSDFDLYVKQGSPPTTVDFDKKQDGPNQYGFLEFDTPTPGDWYVLINRFGGAGIYQLTVTTFASGSPGPGSNGQPCDDQNACTEGDACQSGVCTGAPVTNGTSCDDGSACTGNDSCQDGACTSTVAPALGCKRPFVGGKASLVLKDRSPNQRDSATWKWLKGTTTSLQEFGDPTTTTSYELCIFDESANIPQLVLDAHIPAGSSWSGFSRGYKYRDAEAATDGINAVVLREGDDGTASIVVKGRGAGLDAPVLPLQQDNQVIVQVLNGSTCWEADYGTSRVNDVAEFKAKAD